MWVAVQTADEPRYVIKGLCHSRGQRRCPAGFGSPTSPPSFLRIGYRSILVLRGGCRSGVMERIEKTVFISYRHTNSPRALAARIFAYQQLHSSGVKLPPVGSLNAANVVSCVEHLVNRDGAQNPSTALKAGTCRMCPPPLYAQVILLTFDSAPVFLPLRPFQLCR